jgi:hypothetical protein
MNSKNNPRKYNKLENDVKKLSKNGRNPSISEQNEMLSKINDFNSSVQNRVILHPEVVDASECDSRFDAQHDLSRHDDKEYIYSATGRTATTWESSIFKKLYCDIFMDRLQSELENDENVLLDSMKNVLRRFNFETLLWIQNALKTRKIANIFEIFNNREALPVAIEQDRKLYLKNIKNIIVAFLTLSIFKYRSKVAALDVADDMKFVHNKYVMFKNSKSESLSDLYKMINNLKSEFIQSAKSRFEKSEFKFDSSSFVVVSRKDSIQFVCSDYLRAIMLIHENGDKVVKITDLPYGKYYRNFCSKTKISMKNKKLIYMNNNSVDETQPPAIQRFHL